MLGKDSPDAGLQDASGEAIGEGASRGYDELPEDVQELLRRYTRPARPVARPLFDPHAGRGFVFEMRDIQEHKLVQGIRLEKVEWAWQTESDNAVHFRTEDGIRYELRPLTYDDGLDLWEPEQAGEVGLDHQLAISVGRVVDHLEDTWKRQVEPWAKDGTWKDMFLRMRELLELHEKLEAGS